MIYEFIIKMVGAFMVGSIGFAPVTATMSDGELRVNTTLQHGVTDEILRTVEHQFTFTVDTVVTLIVNDHMQASRIVSHRLEMKSGNWMVDQTPVQDREKLELLMGGIGVAFQNISVRNGDTGTILITSKIRSDDDFYRATGLKVGSLWSYKEPMARSKFYVKNGAAVPAP